MQFHPQIREPFGQRYRSRGLGPAETDFFLSLRRNPFSIASFYFVSLTSQSDVRKNRFRPEPARSVALTKRIAALGILE